MTLNLKFCKIKNYWGLSWRENGGSRSGNINFSISGKGDVTPLIIWYRLWTIDKWRISKGNVVSKIPKEERKAVWRVEERSSLLERDLR